MQDMPIIEIKVENEKVELFEKRNSLSLKRRIKKKRQLTEEEQKFTLQLILPFK